MHLGKGRGGGQAYYFLDHHLETWVLPARPVGTIERVRGLLAAEAGRQGIGHSREYLTHEIMDGKDESEWMIGTLSESYDLMIAR